ncbi:MAG: PDZ domain-containing protein [Planctomycetia bacterium]
MNTNESQGRPTPGASRWYDDVRPLIPLRDGDGLTPDESARVDEAADACPTCRKEVDAFHETYERLRAAGEAPCPTDDRPSLWAAVARKLPDAPPLHRTPLTRRGVFRYVSTVQLAAACVALVGATLYFDGAERRPAAEARGVDAGQVVQVVDADRVDDPSSIVVADATRRGAPLFGVVVHRVDLELAKTMKLLQPFGAAVAYVIPDSPAARLGLRAGDVIVAVGGVPVLKPADLGEVIQRPPRGEPITIDWLREDGEHRGRFVLGRP